MARKRKLTLRVACDEDCTVSAAGMIAFKRGSKSGRGLRGTPGRNRLQLGEPGVVRVKFSRKQAKRVRRGLASGRRAVALITVSATGGGGGTDSVKRTVKQRR